jgi:spermidine/putrescine transport system substrate-binding protein
LPTSFIRAFQAKESVRVEVTEVETPEELWENLASKAPTGEYDVATVFADQAETAAREGWLAELETRELPELKGIHPDFLPPADSAARPRVAPLLWGITGFVQNRTREGETARSWHDLLTQPKLKSRVRLLAWPPLPFTIDSGVAKIKGSWLAFSHSAPDSADVVMVHHGEMAFAPLKDSAWTFMIPQDGAPLWTLSLAALKASQHKHEATRFIAMALEPEWSLQLVNSSHQASTNRALDEKKIDERLLPSYLRKVNLISLRPVKAFTSPN